MYFAKMMGGGVGTVGTEVGKAEDSVLTQALKEPAEETPEGVKHIVNDGDCGPFGCIADLVGQNDGEKKKIKDSIEEFRQSTSNKIRKKITKKLSSNN